MLEYFDKMYKRSYPLDVISDKSTEEYKAFSIKSGLPVKVYSIPELIDFVPLVKEYYKIIREMKTMYVIPCDVFDNEDPMGYVLRGVSEKGYCTVFYEDEEYTPFQPSFGWYDFKDFNKGDPVVIAEGVKDVLYLKKFYKYVISPLSCRVSDEFCEFLSNITDKVITAFDNDSDKKRNAGQIAAKSLSNKLGKVGVNTLNIIPDFGCKDFGQYFMKKELDSKFGLSFNMALSRLRRQ